MERGSVTTSQKERKPSRSGKWEIVFGGRHMDNVQKETHAVSVMTDKHKETCAVVRDEKDDRLFPHQLRRPKPTKGEKNPHESSSDKGSEIQCRYELKKTSSRFWHPPVCQNYKSETGCICGRKFFFRHVEAEEKPSKKSKKDGAKGSVALLKESTQVGCVSQDSCPRRSILREEGKLGSKTRRQILQGHLASNKKFGKERVHRVWKARPRPGCQGYKRSCIGDLSTTSWKMKLTGRRKNRVIREKKMRKEK